MSAMERLVSSPSLVSVITKSRDFCFRSARYSSFCLSGFLLSFVGLTDFERRINERPLFEE